MDPTKITELANLLRKNGDKVLSSEFKLTLSGCLLRALNDSFTLIADQSELCSPQSFQVVKPNNSKSEVFRDLQLIHDFVQKTLLLCVTQFPGDDFFEGNIDISKFRNLKRLEVQKINAKQIIGLQPLRAQLQQLICTRSLQAVEDIITHCAGDNSNGFVWNELKIADFSYNNLTTVDCSLEFAQYLQVLNLSHNQLISVEAIKWLPNLKTLNLSFNRLVNVPNFHVETSKRLQIFNLSNNFIEDLSGISKLESLTELNLADNCLLDHTYLVPLSALITLKYLNLYGNPLYCHPKHRLATAQFLHKNSSTVKFILDFEPLTKREKQVTGKHQGNVHSIFSSRNLAKTSGQATPTQRSLSQTPSSSVGSLRSFQLNESDTSDMNSSIVERPKKLKTRRTVEIEDSKPIVARNDPKTVESEGNKDHLETKKQIEDLREKFGAGWLQSENAKMVHSVLGIDAEPNDAQLNGENKLTSQQIFDDLVNEFKASFDDDDPNSTVLTSTPIDRTGNFDLMKSMESPMKITDADKSLGVKSEDSSVYVSVMEGTFYESTKEDDSGPNLDDIFPNNYDEPEVSDNEDNEVTYIVYGKDNTDEIFLTVSDVSIKEKDTSTRRTKTKWSLKILESCDRMNSNTLRINFDTIRKDKKERVYTVEEGLCQELEKYLREILSKRALSEMNQTIYRCVNCTCQFSRENTYKWNNLETFCPECKSTFVVEVHEIRKSLDNKPKQLNEKKLEPFVSKATATKTQGVQKSSSGEKFSSNEESASHCSIGSAGSLNESSSCSKISNSESSFDSNQSVAGSSTNDRENDFRSNCESDVEILSNPSQSSIEVLDHTSSSRKTSEERRISQIPHLETIDDHIMRMAQNTEVMMGQECADELDETLVKGKEDKGISPAVNGNGNGNDKKTLLGHMNLTESSSSGSVTDSICTAYEQNGEKSADSTLASGDGKKGHKRDESIISSMLGGLFQSTNMLMSRTQKSPDHNPATSIQKCQKYKFNYSDFSDVDHRLQLYLLMKFDDEDEKFKWVVRGKIYNETTGTMMEGILIMTTMKFYLMEAFGPENDDVNKWLRTVFCVTVDRVESVQLLPWKIGFSFQIKGWGGFLLILQDILRTDSLLLFLANHPLPQQCALEYQISENVLKKLSYSANGEQLKMFSILNQCDITAESENILKTFAPSGLFTTDSRLYLTTSNCSWLSATAEKYIELGLTQPMSNLVEVERPADNIFSINFLDETQDKSEFWKCTFETTENAESCLNAIGQSWEKLFGVPLVSN